MKGGPKTKKRYNHEVSKCLLASWLDHSRKPVGHNYFDIQKQKFIFEVGRNAKFAATEYLYMPVFDDGERSQALEDWLSIDESGLGLLCKAAKNGDPHLMPNDPRMIKRALRACVSLGVRSAYHFYSIAKIPGLADLMGTDSAHQAIAKNAFHAIQSSYSRLMNWDFRILYDLPVPLLVNEQPFRDWTLAEGAGEWVSMPLAPSALLIGQPPDDRGRTTLTFAWCHAPDCSRLSEINNGFVLHTARQWVVGSSATQISESASQLSTEKVRVRMAKDRFVFL
jgi:hypothetical protein